MRWLILFGCVTAFLLYASVLDHHFVEFDDGGYVVENEIVQKGLALSGIRWAFTTLRMANWHPLTWVSYMVDASIFGLNPAGYHLTNLLFHLLNMILVFVFARKLTGSLWGPAAVSLLFGLHPLHVESVAWVSERKDVLSACFWFLALIAYMHYAATRRRLSYALSLLCHALGLMAKPMGVTLPALLLLLDIGPLNRYDQSNHAYSASKTHTFFKLLAEKLPFFAISAGSAFVTVIAQDGAGALTTLEQVPLRLRIGNGAASYATYLLQTVWPVRLSVFYPFIAVGTTVAILCSAVLLTITGLAVLSLRKRPVPAFGWLWYVVTLVPVIGIIQVGQQAHADRYTYIPLVGIFLVLVESIRKGCARWSSLRPYAVSVFMAVLVCLGALTHRQVAVWKDTGTLFGHAIAVTEANAIAHNNLGGYLNEEGKPEDAVPHLRQAVEITPTLFHAHYNLALSLALMGDTEGALTSFEEGVRLKPDVIQAYTLMGKILFGKKDYLVAASFFSRALELEPDDPEINYSLGICQLKIGNSDEAVHYLERTLEIEPQNHDARAILCLERVNRGEDEAAAECLVRAREESPSSEAALENMDSAMEKVGKLRRAHISINALAPLKNYGNG